MEISSQKLIRGRNNMANLWFCSDHHFGDERFDILFRPYDSVENFNKDILNNHNSLVKKEDDVFFLVMF